MSHCEATPTQAWTGSLGSRSLRLPECLEDRHMKVSDLSTGRLYPPRDTRSTHFCKWLFYPQVYNAVGRIMSLTPSGIELVTFGFVMQCLNQLRHRVTTEKLRYMELGVKLGLLQ